jgi:hypothetical protein
MKSYSRIVGFPLGFLSNAVVDDSTEMPRMVAWALGRAPYAGDTILAAAAGLIVVRAKYPAPRMGAAFLDNPTVLFGILDRGFNLRLWMPLSSHCVLAHKFREDSLVVK